MVQVRSPYGHVIEVLLEEHLQLGLGVSLCESVQLAVGGHHVQLAPVGHHVRHVPQLRRQRHVLVVDVVDGECVPARC